MDVKKKLSETKTWIKEHPWEIALSVVSGAITYAVLIERSSNKKIEAHRDCVSFAHWVDAKLAEYPGETQQIWKTGEGRGGFVYIEPTKFDEN